MGPQALCSMPRRSKCTWVERLGLGGDQWRVHSMAKYRTPFSLLAHNLFSEPLLLIVVENGGLTPHRTLT